MSIVPKLLSESSSSQTSKHVLRLRDEMKMEIAREYEKTIYILQFLVIDEKEIATRIKENDFGLTVDDFGMLLNIQQNYFSASAAGASQ